MKIIFNTKYQASLIIVITFIMIILSTPPSALAATLALSPSTGTFNRGCNFSLAMNLDTAGAQTDGTDAILNFDPTRITPTSITPGTIYSDFPGTNIDSTGKITISGLASITQPFSGSGTFATIAFSVPANAPTGATQTTFEFDPSNPTKTTDSNVVERDTVRDVLTSVTNGSYTIGTGSCSSQTQTPTTGGTGGSTGGGTLVPGSSTPVGGTIPPPVKTLPPAGTETLTFTLGIIGLTLTVLGALGFALL